MHLDLREENAEWKVWTPEEQENIARGGHASLRKSICKSSRIGKAPKRKADDYIPAGVFHSGDFREDLHKARTGQGEGNGFGICRKDSAICGSILFV